MLSEMYRSGLPRGESRYGDACLFPYGEAKTSTAEPLGERKKKGNGMKPVAKDIPEEAGR